MLVYEDRFYPGKVSPNDVRKMRIDTHAILSAANQKERKKIFGEGEAFVLFFKHV